MATCVPPTNDLIVCPICFDVFRDPKSLPQCLHTFCKSCICSYASTTLNKILGKTNFICPVCRKCYDNVDNIDAWLKNLPKNHLIVTLINQEKMENKEVLCAYCKRQEKNESAIYWCTECSDNLCEKCAKFHEVNRLTMEHKVCNIEAKNQTDSISSVLFCKQHSSRKLEVYCFDHEEPCCLMCATVSHRKCEKVSSLDECSLHSPEKVQRLRTEFDELRKRCDSEVTRVEDDKENFMKESKTIEARVKGLTEEIIQTLRDKEKDPLSSLAKTEKEQTLVLQTKLEELQTVQEKLERSIQLLQLSERFSKIALFWEIKKMEKDVSNIDLQIKNLVKRYKTPVLDLNINEFGHNFHSSLNLFGEIKLKLKTNGVDFRSAKLVLEKSLNVQESSCLTDVEVINGTHLVTVCQNSNMVYFLSGNGTLLASSPLPYTPWGIAALRKHQFQFCVTMQNFNLVGIYKANISDRCIIPCKELQLPHNAYGICTFNDKIIVSLEEKQTEQVFRVYDEEGNYIKAQHSYDNSLCNGIHAISERRLLYTVHCDNSVYSQDLSSTGASTKLYKSFEMVKPIGITSDSEGNLYVACFGSNNVFQLDPQGKFIRKIIQDDPAVQRPYGVRVTFFHDGFKLLLTSGGKILIYNFSEI
ncbi:probable E3 ubiquitin-protein ligase MID2 [Saccostrea cucullata]|uniref:probable E3 ubiquitin-protein ligase MID2 n=1 Tax=Saccostrea cuccullata TaxID=36930 RepID=UPI002ED41520